MTEQAPKTQTDVILRDQSETLPGQWVGSDINLMHELWPELDLTDFRVLLRVCMARGLNPLDKELYPVVYNKDKPRGGRNGRTLVLIESVDAMRRRAHSADLVLDMDGPQFCGEDGEWKDVWPSKDPPFAARFGIQSKTMAQLRWAVRLWSEATKRGQKGDEFWRTPEQGGQPSHMLGLGAERQAWRRFCPGIFKEMYGAGGAAQLEGGRATSPSVGVDVIGWEDAPALEAGDVVADEDGVIDADGPPEATTAPEPPDVDYDIAQVFSLLKTMMVRAEPPFELDHLQLVPGWPEGVPLLHGLASLLEGEAGDETKLAATVYAEVVKAVNGE